MRKMSKKKPLCLFCKKEVDIHNTYYLIDGPNGVKVEVHEHVGVVEHGGMKMLCGKAVEEEEISK